MKMVMMKIVIMMIIMTQVLPSRCTCCLGNLLLREAARPTDQIGRTSVRHLLAGLMFGQKYKWKSCKKVSHSGFWLIWTTFFSSGPCLFASLISLVKRFKSRSIDSELWSYVRWWTFSLVEPPFKEVGNFWPLGSSGIWRLSCSTGPGGQASFWLWSGDITDFQHSFSWSGISLG